MRADNRSGSSGKAWRTSTASGWQSVWQRSSQRFQVWIGSFRNERLMQAICLQCRRALPAIAREESGEFACPCGNKFSYTHGIYRFVSEDDIYEGKYTLTHQRRSTFEKF